MRCWLMKSEPSEMSIDKLAAMPEQTTAWDGVRNYQARNFMRNQMQMGDLVFSITQAVLSRGLPASQKFPGLLILMKPSLIPPASIMTRKPRARIRAGLMLKFDCSEKPGCFRSKS